MAITVPYVLVTNVGGLAQVVANRWVQLKNNSTLVTYTSTGATDGNGRCTVLNVPAGIYTIYASNDGVTYIATTETNFIVPYTTNDQVDLLDQNQTLTGVKTFNAGPIFAGGFTVSAGQKAVFGTGDDVTYLSEANVPSIIDIRIGTVGSPDTSANVPVKVSRTFAGTAGAPFSGQPVGQVSSMMGAISVVDPSSIQGFGLFGLAHTSSTQVSGANGKADGTGVAGVGIAENPTIHLSSGGFFSGIMVTTAGAAEGTTGIQVAAQNKTALGDHSVVAAGFSKSVAIWITAGNAFDMNGAAIEIGNTGIGGHGANAGQYDVGLHANGQVANGHTGAILTALVQDDSTGAYSVLTKGTHATAAWAVNAGSGQVLLGELTAQTTTALLEINTNTTTADPLFEVRGTTASFSNRVVRGNSGSVKFGYAGSSGVWLTGTATGDTCLLPTTSLHIGGSTKVLTIKADNTMGFFAKAPVAQQATTGTATGFTAGAGTAVNDASTFTGGTGATAYRISDIVLALKNYGLMAA